MSFNVVKVEHYGEKEFPAFYQHYAGFIVLFTSPGTGVSIVDDVEPDRVGKVTIHWSLKSNPEHWKRLKSFTIVDSHE